jgi:hypothetical protein
MATVSGTSAVTRVQLPGRRYDRFFFAGMIVVLLVIVFVGFARTYYLAGLLHAPLPAPILHIHGALNTAWMILLLVQTLLISTSNVAIHRMLGIAGFVLAAAMVVVGVLVGANQLHRYAAEGDKILSFETTPLLEIFIFGVLAGAAFVARRKSPAHKRLILLSTIAMSGAAFTRFPLEGIASHTVLAMLLLVAAIAAYDLWSTHRVHLATALGGALIASYLFLAVPIGHTAPWHAFARWVQSWNV